MDAPAGLSRFSLALISLVVIAIYGITTVAQAGMPQPAKRAPARSAAPAEPSDTAPPAPKTPAPKRAAAAGNVPQRAVVVGRSHAFAHVNGIVLLHPAERVERVGFHQASDVASLDLTPSKTAVRPKVLPTRHRPTSPRTAVDVVVHPGWGIRAPVSGVVKRAGTYSLYCNYPDAFVTISPDGHPELEVKMLHVTGLQVRSGDRVVAGETLIAKHATKFPFRSQVDAFTQAPRWPHVHIEVTRLAVPSVVPVLGPSTLAFGC